MTQCEIVLKHMREHGSISTIEAFFDHGITRLSARIWDLRHQGYDISSKTVTKRSEKGATQSYSVYSLRGESDDTV